MKELYLKWPFTSVSWQQLKCAIEGRGKGHSVHLHRNSALCYECPLLWKVPPISSLAITSISSSAPFPSNHLPCPPCFATPGDDGHMCSQSFVCVGFSRETLKPGNTSPYMNFEHILKKSNGPDIYMCTSLCHIQTRK